MEETGKYKISDLVKLTDLPRTTITDWLDRYEQYLTYESQGKRRLYSERTLRIIKEIIAMRDAGINSNDIDQKLAETHPVSPEDITNLKPVPSAGEYEENEDEVGNAPGQTQNQPKNDEYALIARRQADEVARLISGQLQSIAQRLESLERQQQQQTPSRPNFVPWILALMMLMALVAVGYRALNAINKLQAENHAAINAVKQNEAELKQREAELKRRDDELKNRNDELKKRDHQLENITVNLDRTGKEYQQNLTKLQQSLAQQQKEFQQQIEKMAADSNRTRDAVLIQVRENFTAERLSLLKQLDNPDLSKEQRTALLKQLDDLGRKTEAAFSQLETAKPSAPQAPKQP